MSDNPRPRDPSPTTKAPAELLVFGPRYPDCDDEREWWDRHRLAASEWVLRNHPHHDHQTELARFGLSTLLMVPTLRAHGEAIGLEGREPFTWEGIDAYEILFDTLAASGLMRGWDHTKVAAAIRGGAAHFASQGLMDAELHARLDADLELWIPRFNAYMTGGKWPQRGSNPPRRGR